MPPQGSTGASSVDNVFDLIFWISMFFFALIVIVMVVFVFRYRARGRELDSKPGVPKHNFRLELAWTIIPLLIVIGIFYVGLRGFLDMAVPPANAYEVQVTAQRWKWLFTYPNGYVDENLHVPVGRPIQLVMTSEDVIHSFFVPDFRLKMDVVPGRYSKTWFEAKNPGQHQIFCTEYCGTGHSDMLASVVVHEPGGFERWLEDAADFIENLPPAEAGQMLYQQRGCAQCHSVDGRAGIGPTLKGIFGQTHPMQDGSSVTVDEDYIRESILDPQAKVVAGYQPVMPTFQGKLKDKEITVIIAYIKSLTDSGGEQEEG
ncbi:MAG: cytochrome c oxidase subunit II [Candidatus Eisenbacteria bacterium]|nr:cytochrome c oxidase subunit II [Candidatus Latescibacterota bacterium]MBD3302244.1 cytochrome c oxidase subunit II [Candidatus Eisenbacteria bacterium]